MRLGLRPAVLGGIVSIAAACATTAPVLELRHGVRTAAFIQYGAEPLEYSLGVVDGKSFWAAGSQQGGTIAVPGISAAIAAAATTAVRVGGAAAQHQVNQEAELVPNIFRAILNNRPIAADIAQRVMPAAADIWGVAYRPEQLRVISSKSTLADERGVFTWDDPKTDIVVVFSVTNIKLSEKPSVGGLFAAIATVGFNDKDVAPEILNLISVYKRDPADQKLKRVWEGRCGAGLLSMPVTRKFSELRASPNAGAEMFDAAVNVTVEQCKRDLTRLVS